MIVDLDLSLGHLVQTLVDDAQRLAELLNSAEVAVVAISTLADGHVELDLVVGVVRGDLAVEGQMESREMGESEVVETSEPKRKGKRRRSRKGNDE